MQEEFWGDGVESRNVMSSEILIFQASKTATKPWKFFTIAQDGTRLCRKKAIYGNTANLTLRILYHFELFSVSCVTGPLTAPKLVCSHGSHCPWPAVTKYSMRTQAWACPAEILVSRNLARITRHTGLCRSKISAQRSRVTGHAEQFEMVQYILCDEKSQWLCTVYSCFMPGSLEREPSKYGTCIKTLTRAWVGGWVSARP